MGLLKPATNQTAFLKAGFMGFQGSGKTYTASRLLAGILNHFKIKNPRLAMIDTEKSSDFLVDFFKDQKIAFDVVKTRSFKSVVDAIREAEKEKYHAFIVDSVTHIWRELGKSYDKKFGKTDFLVKWQPIKEEWETFTELFMNTSMHFASLGRAGFDWGQEEDERTGKKKAVKLGTKMKAEGEFGYESDILIEMERIRIDKGKTNTDIHRAWVLKDRWDLLDGKYFDDPTWKSFLPIINKLSTGEHFGVDDADSQDLFEDPDRSNYERRKQRDIAVEELQDTLVKYDLAGRSDKVMKARVAMLEKVFGTSSKTAIERMWPEQIKEGIEKIKNECDPNRGNGSQAETKEEQADVNF